MIKIVIFDLDGTLVNSLTDLALSVNYGLSKSGINEQPVENYKKYVGNGRDLLIKRAMGKYADNNELYLTVKKDFDTHYSEHCNDNTTSYPGCLQMLALLSDKGYKTGVLSNKPHEFVGRILDKLYPDHIFTEAWGQKTEYNRKPAPDALHAILKLHNIKPCECIYIGDSDVDVFTADNAGVKMAGVSWGFRGKKELINAGAPFVADTAEELYEYICGLNE